MTKEIYERFYGIKLGKLDSKLECLLNLAKSLLYQEYLPNKTPLLARVPGLHPHFVPAWLRRVISKRIKQKQQAGFPHFPYDFSVDFIRELIHSTQTPTQKPVPFWPDGKRFAIVLTHDVDSDFIFKNKRMLNSFLRLEEGHGFKSAWYFVTFKYKLNHAILKQLATRGHEIGFHGDTHDYRLPYLKEERIRKRLERCKPFLEQYKVRGGRSPVFLWTPRFLKVLAEYLGYDTSFHDTTIGGLSGRREGCCSCFPFFYGKLLEIPTTIPEEFMLGSLGYSPEEILDIQISKMREIRKLGGVVNILTHPEPEISANKVALKIYRGLLKECSRFKDAWCVLPKELEAHWRKRDKSIMQRISV
ncbi:hypothetical protein DRJ48_03815 [Candidatus Woesearchaeota archaeon]|nr:polysaccharide deacetylase family protein [Candidatus Woesearchaeota archaeon]RLE42297.1 MAG: hypothetical protein DRJ48_03815 [Candidatus Woesearchaeota archaeon]